jgi:hypothetical protein
VTTPQKLRILKQEATLFRDGKVPIYLMPDGRFACCWGGKWLVRASVKSLEKHTNAHRPFVKLMCVAENFPSYQDMAPVVMEVSDMQQSYVFDKEGKRRTRHSGCWTRYDSELYAQALALEKKRLKYQEELQAEYEKIREAVRGRRIYPSSFKDLLEKEEEEEE